MVHDLEQFISLITCVHRVHTVRLLVIGGCRYHWPPMLINNISCSDHREYTIIITLTDKGSYYMVDYSWGDQVAQPVHCLVYCSLMIVAVDSIADLQNSIT